MKHKDKLKAPKKAIDIKKYLAKMASFRKTSRKAERIRDEFKRPTRSGLPEESWQISGKE